MTWIVAQRLFVGVEGTDTLALLVKNVAAAIPGFCKLGIIGNCTIKHAESSLQFMLRVEHLTHTIVGRCIFFVQVHSFLEGLQSLIVATQIVQDRPFAIPGGDKRTIVAACFFVGIECIL